MSNLQSRDFITQVIDKYRRLPCLWNPKDSHYRDKFVRNQALDELEELFKSRDPEANRETVLKKIAALRGAFMKELRKVQSSIAKGGEVHIPKLWYYERFHFLKDQDFSLWTQDVSLTPDETSYEGYEVSTEGNDDIDDQFCGSSLHSTSSRYGLKRPPSETEVILDNLAKRLERPVSIEAGRQPFDAFGQHIAERLRAMPSCMASFCQKLISDAIFLGEQQRLGVSSKIVPD